MEYIALELGPLFLFSWYYLHRCGYYCSHWKLLTFFHQSIRLQTHKRHPICINETRAQRTQCELTQYILNATWQQFKNSADKTDELWEKSGEFVNLMSCRLQNHNQIVWHCSVGYVFWTSQGYFRSAESYGRIISKYLKMVKQNSTDEHQFGREWVHNDWASPTRTTFGF